MIDKDFWKDKKVFITGHSGFKGSWLCLWLNSLGAKVTGFSLNPPTNPNLFKLCHIDQYTKTIIGDIRNIKSLHSALMDANPHIVIHMAAQPLVKASYQDPIETYETNVMGTVNLFEATRDVAKRKKNIKAVINVTSDKCYENREWHWGYRENDPMGGYDPYSNSKACSELITACYRNSYFNPEDYQKHGVAAASARSGNVIGGGDWASDRLVPDCIRSLLKGDEIKIRNPHAIRPWQHVLEALGGYIILAQHLYLQGAKYAEGWNFGPKTEDARSVEWIVANICKKWGAEASFKIISDQDKHEAQYLKLDCSKAHFRLGWQPKWELEQAIDKVIEWTRAYQASKDVKEVCLKQIAEYESGD
ncbi:CDP-glucose 4,6-dehydratase [Ectobacillus panaciterrae]|uniref:CDP-glucose 4,6-dehydratase n=1 Tax=Ectobacillus panaciterrae TaxID=363872 RepID=UPI0003F803CE|nr:CDP-glucose 4,6-dehydratase [Ectobacillus panaciterrae]